MNGPVPSNVFEITSGNGPRLIEVLNAQEPKVELIIRCLETYFDGLDKAIISSEEFETLTQQGWKLLRECCDALGLRVKVLFFVRNMASLAVSAYDQTVKRHGEWRDIDEWISGFHWSHYETLKHISRFFSDSDVRVFSYDAERFNLLSAFLKALELEECGFFHDAINLNIAVNRSLDEGERDCLRQINKIFGVLYSKDLSDHFIYTRPKIKSEPVKLSESSLRLLEEKYREAAEWINKSYFSGCSVVFVSNREFVNSQNNLQTTEVDKSYLQTKDIFIAWLLDKLSKPQGDIAQIFCDCLRNIDWDNACHPFIPDDFDPFAYLLCNLDLVIANVRPYEHFVAFGRDEGRVYKWMK